MVKYTWDVFSTLDSFGTTEEWGGYWGKQGPEFLERRERLYEPDQLIVLGATGFQTMAEILNGPDVVPDPWIARMIQLPMVVPSRSLDASAAQAWPNTTILDEDAIDAVARLKQESEVPLRSHGSMSMNRSLLKAGLIDQIQVSLFPAITARSGQDPLFAGSEDFDLELVEQRLLDGRILELTYHPSPHRALS